MKPQYQIARTFWQRLRGAIGKKEPFTPLFFPRCQNIHTCFMRQSIHLQWVDKNGQVIQTVKNVQPWKLKSNTKAYGVIEYPENYVFNENNNS